MDPRPTRRTTSTFPISVPNLDKMMKLWNLPRSVLRICDDAHGNNLFRFEQSNDGDRDIIGIIEHLGYNTILISSYL